MTCCAPRSSSSPWSRSRWACPTSRCWDPAAAAGWPADSACRGRGPRSVFSSRAGGPEAPSVGGAAAVAGLSTRAAAHASVPVDVGGDLDLWVDPELSGPAVGSGHRPDHAAPGTAARPTGNGLAVLRTAALAGTVRRASEHSAGQVGSERLLPVVPELRDLLPGRGLRRGATIAVLTTAERSVGATSLMFALLAAASGAGSWCAVVGVPTPGAPAAAEAGIALERLALVPNPGPDWTTGVAALLDGCDIVVAAPPGPIAPSVANRLAAGARQRGTVFVSFGRWAGADITFD